MCHPEDSLGEEAKERGYGFLRLCKELLDLDTKEGAYCATNVIEHYQSKIHLFGSLQCTAWCKWHQVNGHLYGKEYWQWLLGERMKSKRQVQEFIKVANLVLDCGGHVYFEWPKGCKGHELEVLRAWVKERGLGCVEVHGCELGVVDKNNDRIHKPWWIYSSNQDFIDSLWDYKCKGDHEHVQCAGCRTTGTGFYPPYMAQKLLDGMGYNVQGGAVPAMVCEALTVESFKPKQGEYRNHNAELHESMMAMVARVVGFKELRTNQNAMDAVDIEMGKLRKNDVWDEAHPKRRVDVVKDAERRKVEVHLGRIFATCTEKNFEMPEWLRKWKGRVCFDGRPHMVKTGLNKNAIFQHLDSLPASMAAGKNCMAYGLLPGFFVEGADAIQAYTQAVWDGEETWLELAFEHWPESWKKIFKKEDRPMCKLLRNIYGHPQAGPRFERWADKQFRSIGYTPIENWKGCYFHPKLLTLLVAYVDDLTLAGPEKNKKIAWEAI